MPFEDGDLDMTDVPPLGPDFDDSAGVDAEMNAEMINSTSIADNSTDTTKEGSPPMAERLIHAELHPEYASEYLGIVDTFELPLRFTTGVDEREDEGDGSRPSIFEVRDISLGQATNEDSASCAVSSTGGTILNSEQQPERKNREVSHIFAARSSPAYETRIVDFLKERFRDYNEEPALTETHQSRFVASGGYLPHSDYLPPEGQGVEIAFDDIDACDIGGVDALVLQPITNPGIPSSSAEDLPTVFNTNGARPMPSCRVYRVDLPPDTEEVRAVQDLRAQARMARSDAKRDGVITVDSVRCSLRAKPFVLPFDNSHRTPLHDDARLEGHFRWSERVTWPPEDFLELDGSTSEISDRFCFVRRLPHQVSHVQGDSFVEEGPTRIYIWRTTAGTVGSRATSLTSRPVPSSGLKDDDTEKNLASFPQLDEISVSYVAAYPFDSEMIYDTQKDEVATSRHTLRDITFNVAESYTSSPGGDVAEKLVEESVKEPTGRWAIARRSGIQNFEVPTQPDEAFVLEKVRTHMMRGSPDPKVLIDTFGVFSSPLTSFSEECSDHRSPCDPLPADKDHVQIHIADRAFGQPDIRVRVSHSRAMPSAGVRSDSERGSRLNPPWIYDYTQVVLPVSSQDGRKLLDDYNYALSCQSSIQTSIRTTGFGIQSHTSINQIEGDTYVHGTLNPHELSIASSNGLFELRPDMTVYDQQLNTDTTCLSRITLKDGSVCQYDVPAVGQTTLKGAATVWIQRRYARSQSSQSHSPPSSIPSAPPSAPSQLHSARNVFLWSLLAASGLPYA